MSLAIHPIISEEIGLPCVVNGIGVQKKQCHIIRNNGCNLHQIIFSTKGCGILKVNGKTEEIPEGSYFYLKADEPHEYYAENNLWETQWIMFSGANIENLLNLFTFTKSKVVCAHNTVRSLKIFNDIASTLKSSNKFNGFEASSLLYSLFIELYKSQESLESTTTYNNKNLIKPVIDYINLNYNKDIELETLAELIDVTPQYLCKVFKNNIYMRPFEYITRCRMQEAKKLLLSSDMTIKDISLSVGYRDTSYFCANFKKYESMSPSQFRGSL